MIQGASAEKDWQKGKKINLYLPLREHTNKPDVRLKIICTSFWTAAQPVQAHVPGKVR